MAFEFPIRVYWEDTDAGGIVFYANYLKFFERARTEWLRALGHRASSSAARGKRAACSWSVTDRPSCTYLRAARLDDQLLVTAELPKHAGVLR